MDTFCNTCMKSFPPVRESPPLPPEPPPLDDAEEEEEADDDAADAAELLELDAREDDAELEVEPPKRFDVALKAAVEPPLLAEDVEATVAPVDALAVEVEDSCEPLLSLPPPPPEPPLDAVIITAPPRPPMDVTTLTPPPRRPRSWGTVRDTYRSATVTPDSRNDCSNWPPATVAVRSTLPELPPAFGASLPERER